MQRLKIEMLDDANFRYGPDISNDKVLLNLVIKMGLDPSQAEQVQHSQNIAQQQTNRFRRKP